MNEPKSQDKPQLITEHKPEHEPEHEDFFDYCERCDSNQWHSWDLDSNSYECDSCFNRDLCEGDVYDYEK